MYKLEKLVEALVGKYWQGEKICKMEIKILSQKKKRRISKPSLQWIMLLEYDLSVSEYLPFKINMTFLKYFSNAL